MMTINNEQSPIMTTCNSIEVPEASVTADVPCELFHIKQADGYSGAVRLFNSRMAHTPTNIRSGADSINNAGRDGEGIAVLYLHGIQSHSGWFMRSMDYLRSRGATVLAPDRRGSGLNQHQRGHCQSPEQLLCDVDCCINWLINYSDVRRVHIVAVSWSGKLALVYAARHAGKVASLTLVAPGLCPRIHIGLKEKIKIGINGVFDAYKLHEIPLRQPTLFTTNPDMLPFINHDPLRLTHTTASFLITSTRFDMAVRKVIRDIKVPVHLFLAGRDRIIDNDATTALLAPLLAAKDDNDNSGIVDTNASNISTNNINCKNIADINGVSHCIHFYNDASHTLEFEPMPNSYFSDLVRTIIPCYPCCEH